MRVLYFAGAATVAGCDAEDWDTDAARMTLADFWSEAIRRHPNLADWSRKCRVASGLEYVPEGGSLDTNAEAAVIPPVSGG